MNKIIIIAFLLPFLVLTSCSSRTVEDYKVRVIIDQTVGFVPTLENIKFENELEKWQNQGWFICLLTLYWMPTQPQPIFFTDLNKIKIGSNYDFVQLSSRDCIVSVSGRNGDPLYLTDGKLKYEICDLGENIAFTVNIGPGSDLFIYH